MQKVRLNEWSKKNDLQIGTATPWGYYGLKKKIKIGSIKVLIWKFWF